MRAPRVAWCFTSEVRGRPDFLRGSGLQGVRSRGGIFDRLANLSSIHSVIVQNPCGRTLRFASNSKQYVLRPDPLNLAACGFVSCRGKNLFCSFRERKVGLSSGLGAVAGAFADGFGDILQ